MQNPTAGCACAASEKISRVSLRRMCGGAVLRLQSAPGFRQKTDARQEIDLRTFVLKVAPRLNRSTTTGTEGLHKPDSSDPYSRSVTLTDAPESNTGHAARIVTRRVETPRLRKPQVRRAGKAAPAPSPAWCARTPPRVSVSQFKFAGTGSRRRLSLPRRCSEKTSANLESLILLLLCNRSRKPELTATLKRVEAACC